MYALGLILLVMLAQHSDLKMPAPVQVVWRAAVKRPILCNLPIKSKQYPYLGLFYLYFSFPVCRSMLASLVAVTE
jgi:hypothetical protein